jgi:hypothetical protein
MKGDHDDNDDRTKIAEWDDDARDHGTPHAADDRPRLWNRQGTNVEPAWPFLGQRLRRKGRAAGKNEVNQRLVGISCCFSISRAGNGEGASEFSLAPKNAGRIDVPQAEDALAPLLHPATFGAASVLKTEPHMGTTREGERVLGSCGAGQVKEVIGGDQIKAGDTKQIVRERRCIPK